MTAYGVTTEGFVSKDLQTIKDEIKADFLSVYGEGLNVDDRSRVGQLIGIMAGREELVWELAQAVYNAAYPATAGGAALVDLARLTGTVPKSPTSSTVDVTCTGTPGTAIAAGKTASVAVAGTKFDVVTGGSIAAATAWASGTGYTAGDIRTNSGNIYLCITSGTSAGSGGPTGTGSDITDNTAHWRFLGVGTGFVTLPFAAESTGPLPANAGSLTVIETPVAGWNGAYNIEDAVLGIAAETDPQLRARREAELAASGNATLPAIPADVLGVELADGSKPVTAVKLFENTGQVTDGDGLPPGSIQVVALYPNAPDSATDQAIAQAIFNSRGAGIQTYGSVSKTVVDTQGQSHTVNFDYPTEKDVWIRVDVLTDPTLFPADGAAQIKAALVAFAARYEIGSDVITSQLFAPIFDNVPGVLDVTVLYIGLSNPPVAGTNIVIGSRELAKFDTGRITVNVS